MVKINFSEIKSPTIKVIPKYTYTKIQDSRYKNFSCSKVELNEEFLKYLQEQNNLKNEPIILGNDDSIGAELIFEKDGVIVITLNKITIEELEIYKKLNYDKKLIEKELKL